MKGCIALLGWLYNQPGEVTSYVETYKRWGQAASKSVGNGMARGWNDRRKGGMGAPCKGALWKGGRGGACVRALMHACGWPGAEWVVGGQAVRLVGGNILFSFASANFLPTSRTFVHNSNILPSWVPDCPDGCSFCPLALSSSGQHGSASCGHAGCFV